MGCTARSSVALVASAALMAAWGCGESRQGDRGTTPKAEATVTGKVTINGKPAQKGHITFEPLDANGLPTGSKAAEVGKDGTYTITTQTGSNDITAASTGDPAADASYNKTNFDVQPGSNTLNLDLPIKP